MLKRARNFFHTQRRNSVLKFAHFAPPARTVADIGCGAGFYSFAAKAAGLKVCSIDICERAIRRLRPFVDDARVADLMNLRHLELAERYDIVIGDGVMDRVRSRRSAMRGLAELLAPQGRLVLNVSTFGAEWYVRNCRAAGLVLCASERPMPLNMTLMFRKRETLASETRLKISDNFARFIHPADAAAAFDDAETGNLPLTAPCE